MSAWSTSRSLPPAATVPPMTRLYRKIAVVATRRGLLIRPYDTDADSHAPYRGAAVLIKWKTSVPQQIDAIAEDDSDSVLVPVDGIAGLLKGFSDSYLILIADSIHAATLPDSHSSKIRTVASLVAIPLGSFEVAQPILEKYAARQARYRQSVTSLGSFLGGGGAKKRPESDSDSNDSSDDDEGDDGREGRALHEAVQEADASPIVPSANAKRPFWQRAFSRNRTSNVALEPELATSRDHPAAADGGAPASVRDGPNEASPTRPSEASTLADVAAEATISPQDEDQDEDVRESQKELDDKLVAETLRTFRGLYFSFETDITRTLQAKKAAKTTEGESFDHLPLWRRADKRFWFNAHLVSPFVAAGLHSYIIVLQQGFAHEITVALPLQPYQSLSSIADPDAPTSIDLTLVLVSRRSIERPGLRYQRRGINPSGGVANFVETEFMISCVRDGTKHCCAFVQIRGSIPAYWSQSPWALKPPPVLERTPKDTKEAMGKHIDALEARYGRVIIVNLAEQSGKEGAVVAAFREGMQSLDKAEEKVRYLEWDFHHLTKGMHYENISKLIDLIRDDLEELRSFWSTPEEVYSLQTGVARINCIDSLDRTNVVQSAISRWVMNRHLVHLGIASGETDGMHDALDIAFNSLWADNGDAISREYSGTSALKGDFTRTGKRNFLGALNDASNSIVRLGNSVVSDFFKQASIDYILGVNRYAFEEFSERLETSDPREILRLAQIRQEAIETSTEEVLLEGEEKLGGWTLISPSEIDTVRPGKGGKFEEKVLLLTNKAVYVVQYEFTLQKVVSSVRIPTGSILSLQTGQYILSSLDSSTTNPVENYGFVLRYAASDATEKIRTYTLKTQSPQKDTAITAKNVGSRLSASIGLKPLRLPGSIPSTPTKANSAASSSSTPSNTAAVPDGGAGSQQQHFIAFKALRRDAIKVATANGASQIIESRAGAGDGTHGETRKTAKDVVRSIVDKLKDEAEKIGAVDPKEDWVHEKDIISLAESKAQTPLVDKLSHALYRAIWL